MKSERREKKRKNLLKFKAKEPYRPKEKKKSLRDYRKNKTT